MNRSKLFFLFSCALLSAPAIAGSQGQAQMGVSAVIVAPAVPVRDNTKMVLSASSQQDKQVVKQKATETVVTVDSMFWVQDWGRTFSSDPSPSFDVILIRTIEY